MQNYSAKNKPKKKPQKIGMLNKFKFQMNLKIAALSERSMAKRSIHCMIPFKWNSKKFKLIYNDRKQISGCLWILAEGGMHYKGAIGEFKERKIIVNLIMVMVSWLYYICQNG